MASGWEDRRPGAMEAAGARLVEISEPARPRHSASGAARTCRISRRPTGPAATSTTGTGRTDRADSPRAFSTKARRSRRTSTMLRAASARGGRKAAERTVSDLRRPARPLGFRPCSRRARLHRRPGAEQALDPNRQSVRQRAGPSNLRRATARPDHRHAIRPRCGGAGDRRTPGTAVEGKLKRNGSGTAAKFRQSAGLKR